jgi:hypothetical protein
VAVEDLKRLLTAGTDPQSEASEIRIPMSVWRSFGFAERTDLSVKFFRTIPRMIDANALGSS